MALHELDVIKRPLITEKAVLQKEEVGHYSFEVSRAASKRDIRQALKKLFQVDAVSVRTLMVRGKQRRIGRHVGKKSDWKKAIVTLAKGQKIEQFEAK